MTELQEQKYHAAVQAILDQKPLRINAHIYLIENGDVWLRFTEKPETEVDGYQLHLLLTVLKERCPLCQLNIAHMIHMKGE